MEDPSPNWRDGSLAVTTMSSAYTSDDGKVYTHVNHLDEIQEYLFDAAKLNTFSNTYYGVLGPAVDANDFIGLPTCTLDDVNFIQPAAHSAVLVAWFTPPNVDQQYFAGIFVSKWGIGGLWCHRFARGYCPDEYFQTFHLSVFAPVGTDWDDNSPPYLIDYSPWGLFD